MKMTLSQLLEGLSHDTLSFMADSNHATGSIAGDQIPKVTSRINSVLRRLAVKFVLSEKRVQVRLTQDRRYYALTPGSPWLVPDPGNPFLGDVAQILGIITPDGKTHNLNDVAPHDSILVKDGGVSIEIDQYVPLGVATLIYKAVTPQFDLKDLKLDQQIEIPEALLNALYLGVAGITYEGIGGAENVQLSVSKWAQFEKECAEAKINSAVENQTYEERNLFRDRGFK